MARGKVALKVIECPFCAIIHNCVVTIPYKTIKMKCRACGNSIKTILQHKFSTVEQEQIQKVVNRKRFSFFSNYSIDHREYKDPVKEILKDYDEKERFAFLNTLIAILTNPIEFAKFKAFVEKDKVERENVQ